MKNPKKKSKSPIILQYNLFDKRCVDVMQRNKPTTKFPINFLKNKSCTG